VGSDACRRPLRGPGRNGRRSDRLCGLAENLVVATATVRTSAGRRVTGRQLRALEFLAERQAIDLAELAAERYSVAEPTERSITQASDLIQMLKEQD
jgi:hypothetical protein